MFGSAYAVQTAKPDIRLQRFSAPIGATQKLSAPNRLCDLMTASHEFEITKVIERHFDTTGKAMTFSFFVLWRKEREKDQQKRRLQCRREGALLSQSVSGRVARHELAGRRQVSNRHAFSVKSFCSQIPYY